MIGLESTRVILINKGHPSTCEETPDRISPEELLYNLVWMEDLDLLLTKKQKPWYVRTPKSVMEIRLISLDERQKITDKFKELF